VDIFGATELSSSDAELGDMNGLRPRLQATDRTPAGDRTESVSKWEFFSADVALTTAFVLSLSSSGKKISSCLLLS